MPTRKCRSCPPPRSTVTPPSGKPGLPKTTTSGRDGMRGPVPTKPGK